MAWVLARLAIWTGSSPLTIGSVSTPIWRPRISSCSIAAGRLVSSEAISTRLPSRSVRRLASLAVVVVLPDALQADHQDRRRRVVDLQLAGFVLALEHADQLVMDDLDHLLARGDRLGHRRAGRLALHRRHEVARDRQRDVRLEQGDPDLAQRGLHVLGASARPAWSAGRRRRRGGRTGIRTSAPRGLQVGSGPARRRTGRRNGERPRGRICADGGRSPVSVGGPEAWHFRNGAQMDQRGRKVKRGGRLPARGPPPAGGQPGLRGVRVLLVRRDVVRFASRARAGCDEFSARPLPGRPLPGRWWRPPASPWPARPRPLPPQLLPPARR